MARGPKGKPAVLHLVEGTRHTTRHGSEEELRDKVENSQQAFGKLEKPESFTERTLPKLGTVTLSQHGGWTHQKKHAPLLIAFFGQISCAKVLCFLRPSMANCAATQQN
jgi:hypothetical protein